MSESNRSTTSELTDTFIEKTKLETFTFRDETFTCERRYYLWEETGFECTDSEQDDEVFWKVVELYRLKHPDGTDLPVKE
jgi:hypothetical protein